MNFLQRRFRLSTAVAQFVLLVLFATCAVADERPPIVLTDEAQKLHGSSLVVDGHNDLPWEIRDQGSASFTKLDISQPQHKLHTDIPRLRKGGVGAQFWSVWVPPYTADDGTALAMTLEQIELVKVMIARYPETFELALTPEDVKRIYGEGKIASMIGVEGGHCIENSIGVLRQLFNLGARYMTLTHNDSLDWADSGTDKPKVGGLNDFGREVVREMNRLGMLVDISHVSEKTMQDTLDVTSAPVIFSHSSARTIADHPRNVPDAILQQLPENGGVVMVNYYSIFVVPAAAERGRQQLKFESELKKQGLSGAERRTEVERWRLQNPAPAGTIHDVLDHIDHIAKVAGVDHVGIGSDYDGVTLLPVQLEDVSTYPYITQGLLDRGYSADDIRKILGGNVMRVWSEAHKAAARGG
ncbi:MAG: dipeptidase, partial [Pirellulales bacterium]